MCLLHKRRHKERSPGDESPRLLFILQFSGKEGYFAAASEALRNSFISFSTSSEALRARVPAALFPFSS